MSLAARQRSRRLLPRLAAALLLTVTRVPSASAQSTNSTVSLSLAPPVADNATSIDVLYESAAPFAGFQFSLNVDGGGAAPLESVNQAATAASTDDNFTVVSFADGKVLGFSFDSEALIPATSDGPELLVSLALNLTDSSEEEQEQLEAACFVAGSVVITSADAAEIDASAEPVCESPDVGESPGDSGTNATAAPAPAPEAGDEAPTLDNPPKIAFNAAINDEYGTGGGRAVVEITYTSEIPLQAVELRLVDLATGDSVSFEGYATAVGAVAAIDAEVELINATGTVLIQSTGDLSSNQTEAEWEALALPATTTEELLITLLIDLTSATEKVCLAPANVLDRNLEPLASEATPTCVGVPKPPSPPPALTSADYPNFIATYAVRAGNKAVVEVTYTSGVPLQAVELRLVDPSTGLDVDYSGYQESAGAVAAVDAEVTLSGFGTALVQKTGGLSFNQTDAEWEASALPAAAEPQLLITLLVDLLANDTDAGGVCVASAIALDRDLELITTNSAPTCVGVPKPPPSSEPLSDEASPLSLSVEIDGDGDEVSVTYQSDAPLAGLEFVLKGADTEDPLPLSGASAGGAAAAAGVPVTAEPGTGEVRVLSLGGNTLPATTKPTLLTKLSLNGDTHTMPDGTAMPGAAHGVCVLRAVAVAETTFSIADVDFEENECAVGVPPVPPPAPSSCTGKSDSCNDEDTDLFASPVAADGTVTVFVSTPSLSNVSVGALQFSLRDATTGDLLDLDVGAFGSDAAVGAGAAAEAGMDVTVTLHQVVVVGLDGETLPVDDLNATLLSVRLKGGPGSLAAGTPVCVDGDAIATDADGASLDVDASCSDALIGVAKPETPSVELSLSNVQTTEAGDQSLREAALSYSCESATDVTELRFTVTDADGVPLPVSQVLGSAYANVAGFAFSTDLAGLSVVATGTTPGAHLALSETTEPVVLARVFLNASTIQPGARLCTSDESASSDHSLSVSWPCEREAIAAEQIEGGDGNGGDPGDGGDTAQAPTGGSNDDGGGGLSGGAIFGIIVGSVVGAALLLALGMFLWQRRTQDRMPTVRGSSFTSNAIQGSAAGVGGFTNGGGNAGSGAIGGAGVGAVHGTQKTGQRTKFIEMSDMSDMV